MLFWPEPQIDEWHFLSLELSTLCYALMNSIVPYTNQVLPLLEQLTPSTGDRVKLLQSPYFFRPLVPTLLTPSPLLTGILYSPQFRSHQETKMAARRTQRSTSTISRENRGLWTVYLKHVSMLSPTGVGGGGPRAYVGHLTSIAFPILAREFDWESGSQGRDVCFFCTEEWDQVTSHVLICVPMLISVS